MIKECLLGGPYMHKQPWLGSEKFNRQFYSKNVHICGEELFFFPHKK